MSTPPPPKKNKVDTDKHDSMFELEAVERSLDSLERAMETKKHWHLQGREHLQQMLSATRRTEEAFHEEIDDGSFRTARFSGKVRSGVSRSSMGMAGVFLFPAYWAVLSV